MVTSAKTNDKPGTDADPLERVLSALRAVGIDPRQSGLGWSARCPAHADRKASLSIDRGFDGKALVKCHAGCTLASICDALSITQADLFPEDRNGHYAAPSGRAWTGRATGRTDGPPSPPPLPKTPSSKPTYPTAEAAIAALRLGTPSATWTYHDIHGGAVAVVARWDRDDGKEIRPVCRAGDAWQIGAPPAPRPLYGLPALAARPDDVVFVLEGEKCVDAATACGLLAVTSMSGAEAASKSDWSPLEGKHVVILPDNDKPGEKYAADVARFARGAGAASVKIVPAPVWTGRDDPPKGFDLADALEECTDDDSRRTLGRIILEAAEGIDDEPGKDDPPDNPGDDDEPPPKWPKAVYPDELGDDEPIDWILEGFLARGHITLMSALMKCGKTTLLSHSLRALQLGGLFLERECSPTKTLLVTEESRALWRKRRDAFGFNRSLSFMCRPLRAKPTHGDWQEFVQHIHRQALERECGAVIIDTVSAFAPWKSENDSAEVMATMTPLNVLTESNLAVLLMHHHGKADGTEGRAARGSTALAGAADILLELRRYKPDDMDDRRRVLAGLGRFDETPQELVIELAADGSHYIVAGNRKSVRNAETTAAIIDALPSIPPGSTADDIHAEMPESSRPKKGDLRAILRAGVADGNWQSTGEGKPSNPWRFWRSR